MKDYAGHFHYRSDRRRRRRVARRRRVDVRPDGYHRTCHHHGNAYLRRRDRQTYRRVLDATGPTLAGHALAEPG